MWRSQCVGQVRVKVFVFREACSNHGAWGVVASVKTRGSAVADSVNASSLCTELKVTGAARQGLKGVSGI